MLLCFCNETKLTSVCWKKKQDKKDEIEDPEKVAGKAVKTKVGNEEKEDQEEKKEQAGKGKALEATEFRLVQPS